MTIDPPVEIIKLIKINNGTVTIDKRATKKQLDIFKKFKKEFDLAIKESESYLVKR